MCKRSCVFWPLSLTEVFFIFVFSLRVPFIFIIIIQAHTMLLLTSALYFSSGYTLHLECPCSVLPLASCPSFSRLICITVVQFSHLQNDGAWALRIAKIPDLFQFCSSVSLAALYISRSHTQPIAVSSKDDTLLNYWVLSGSSWTQQVLRGPGQKSISLELNRPPFKSQIKRLLSAALDKSLLYIW